MSRHTVEHRIREIEEGITNDLTLMLPVVAYFAGVRDQVNMAIAKYGLVSLTIDGWEDYAKMPTLAFTVHIPT